MAFRISATLAERVLANRANGKTSEMLAHEVVAATPNDMVKVRIPGGISATFKREDDVGKTFRQLYGDFTAQNILNTQAERIYSGQYTGRAQASDSLKVAFGGQVSLGDKALEVTLTACMESDDVACQEWAIGVVEGAQEEPTTTPAPTPKKARKAKATETPSQLVGKA